MLDGRWRYYFQPGSSQTRREQRQKGDKSRKSCDITTFWSTLDIMSKQTQSVPIVPLQLPENVARVHAQLLQWYEAEQRELPWRMTNDPYAIVVSEIMLQQTQVDRVLPKYQ